MRSSSSCTITVTSAPTSSGTFPTLSATNNGFYTSSTACFHLQTPISSRCQTTANPTSASFSTPLACLSSAPLPRRHLSLPSLVVLHGPPPIVSWCSIERAQQTLSRCQTIANPPGRHLLFLLVKRSLCHLFTGTIATKMPSLISLPRAPLRAIAHVSRCYALPPNREPAVAISRRFPATTMPLPIARPHAATFHPTGHVASAPARLLLSMIFGQSLLPLTDSVESSGFHPLARRQSGTLWQLSFSCGVPLLRARVLHATPCSYPSDCGLYVRGLFQSLCPLIRPLIPVCHCFYLPSCALL
ncbi:hypothetical protein BHE74_00024082 [Ensete ventricosum]|nr:hypothetical protein BHE74_00024082 [Ensete ventricosum]